MLKSKWLHIANKFYSLFINIGSNFQSLFLLYMRLTWGHQLMNKGNSLLEIIIGALFIIGFGSRVAAIPIIYFTVHLLGTVHMANISDLKFLTEPSLLVIQEPYPFLLTAVLLFVFGPGRISIDGWLKRWVSMQPRY